VRALARWRDLGIDPKSADHQAAYLLARQATDRPRVESVLAIINSKVEQASSSARLSTEFYLVPSQNFPLGVPPELSRWHVLEQDIRANYQVPAETDLSAALIFDGACSQTLLGLRVKRMTFEDKLSRQWVVASSSAASAADADLEALPAAPAPAQATPTAACAPAAAKAPTQPKAAAAKAASPAAAAPAAAANATDTPSRPPESSEPAVKKARVLKMMGSEDALRRHRDTPPSPGEGETNQITRDPRYLAWAPSAGEVIFAFPRTQCKEMAPDDAEAFS